MIHMRRECRNDSAWTASDIEGPIRRLLSRHINQEREEVFVVKLGRCGKFACLTCELIIDECCVCG